MTAQMILKPDGKWTIVVSPSNSSDSIEGPLFLQLERSTLTVRSFGGELHIEAQKP